MFVTKTRFTSLLLAAILVAASSSSDVHATPVTSGLQLWLDGSDPDGDTVVEGVGESGISGATVTWTDKSGNARNFAQSTAARQPVYSSTGFSNSKGAFDFTGGNGTDANGDVLTYGGTGPLAAGDDDYTYVVVWNADLHNQFRYIYTQGPETTSLRSALILSNTTYGFNGFNNDANGFVSSAAGQNNLTIMQADNNNRFSVSGGPNIRVYDEGNLFVATTGNPATLNISNTPSFVGSSTGAKEFFDGKIAEVLVYDRLLNEPEINQVGNYLETKYALTWNDIAEPKYWDSNGATAGAGATPNGAWGIDNFWNNDSSGGAGTFTTATVAADQVVFSAGADATGSYAVGVNGAQSVTKVTFQEGSVTLSGGSLAISGNLTHATPGATTLSTPTALSGTLDHSNGMFAIGSTLTGPTGAWTIQNGGNQANGWLEVATGASITAASVSVTGSVSNTVVKQTGGTLATTGNFAIGTNDGSSAGSNAFAYMSGGTLNVGGLFHVRPLTNVANANDSAFFIMSAGTVNANGVETFVGSVNNGGQSTIVMSGGSFTSVGQVRLLPFQDASSLLVMGGNSTFTVNSVSGIQVGGAGVQNRGPGQIYLSDSSLLTAQKIFKNTTTIPSILPSTVIFNGGTLRAGVTNNTDFLGPALTPAGGNQALGSTFEGNYVRVFSGGATIDTQSFNVTANPAFFERSGGTTQQNVATVTGINAGNAGANYAIAPAVGFSGGGGTGAAGFATLDGNGGIAAIVITDPGTGYTSAPTVTLTGGTLRTAGGVAATPVGWTVNLRSASAGGLTKTGAGTLALASGASTYTGATIVNNGTLSIGTLANGGSNSSIGKSSNAAANLVLSGGTLRYTGGAVSTDRLFSVGTGGGTLQNNGSGAVNFNNAGAMGFNGQSGARQLTLAGTETGANTIAAVIGDNGGSTSLTKIGAGQWVLSGNNTYTGDTAINQGTLALSHVSNNNISGTPLITVVGGAFLDVTGLGGGTGLILANGQKLTGSGTINGNMMVAAGSTIAPGSSPGPIVNNGNEIWDGAGSFEFEINDAGAANPLPTGTAGNDPGWDLLSITGTLTITATNANPFVIELIGLTLGNVLGVVNDFDSTAPDAWMFADSGLNISGYAIDKFFIDDTGFAAANPYTGTFSVVLGSSVGGDDSQLWLTYSPAAEAVPEPGTLALAALGLLGVGLAVWRKRR